MILPVTSDLRSAPQSTLGQLRDILADQSELYHDFTCRVEDLFICEESGSLVVRSQHFREYVFRPHALHQLCNRIGVPGSYIDKCPARLASENVNYWLYENRDKEVLVRCDGDEVRAVLSSRYMPVNHGDLIRWVSGSVGDDVPLRFELNERTLDIQFIGKHERDVGANDLISNGLTLRNSEVGLACVEFSAFIFRKVCLNGLIMGGKSSAWKRRHIGDVAIAEEIKGVIAGLSEQSREALGIFGDTQSIKVGDVPGMFDRIAVRYKLTEPQQRAIETSFQQEPGDTLWSVINGVTGAAHDPELDVDQRLQLQHIGGRMLELAKTGTRWLD